ncbi:MAG: manganese efflux pump MntP family protein [Vulcanimicrobiota bacterium]
MNFWTIFFIAVGLAMDAFAVSIASGLEIKKMKKRYALKIAFFFGLFQAFMPILGWYSGKQFSHLFSLIDHWIAFGLLSFIGIKMIVESGKLEKEKADPLNICTLFILSLATSIDALAVGFSYSLLNVDILFPVIVIGLVTFILSFSGVYLGKSIGHFHEKKIEMAGGIILIIIGLKILIEHLFFN